MTSRPPTNRRFALRAALLALAASWALASPSRAEPATTLSEADYLDRARAFWLGQCIANWTGLRTEGTRSSAPFYTDADWGTQPPGLPNPITFVTWGNPWAADDDTDIEYVYLHLLSQHGTLTLTAEQIAAGWLLHMDPAWIWVSNASARQLMVRGVRPPATGLFTPNSNGLMIDAQLTTEFFGALAPGMPELALRAADLPIRTTSCGYATHAAQFYAALYALSWRVDRSLTPRDQILWMVDRARAFIPDASKAADVCDFVLADFLANPDPDDWESTRDKVYQRYQLNAPANGFVYRAWWESSVNFATGLIALLYGDLDFRRTVQIGTLSGWDSDNGTATMGAMVAMMNGTAALAAQFPGVSLSDRYWIDRTRDNLPDYLPADPQAEDTFTLMAARMLPLARQAIASGGGRLDGAPGLWLMGAIAPPAAALAQVPTRQEHLRSANRRVRDEGGIVSASSSVSAAPWCCEVFGVGTPAIFANSAESDWSGIEEPSGAGSRRGFYSSQNGGLATGQTLTLTVAYDRPVGVHTIRFIEGDHFNQSGLVGGWFTSLTWEALVGGTWVALTGTPGDALDAARPFQIVDFVLSAPVIATAIRVSGPVGGAQAFATATELDALAAPAPPPPPTFDLNNSGAPDVEDLYAWESAPVDLDGSGTADSADRRYLTSDLRWRESQDTTSP